ncbi:cysteine proteinase inhibitor 1-like [Rosa rugosa]|uniref:cysteine proteinase inhibitor 1-like n=1 Tax=Rosa rugosa TaxID=74645 RepID=UPI002B40D3A4|nr:cysteine proteinase inhibitor 1-like [Rosa rugosa]XP_062013704.1 cysteine proteinase inhibitor 1-like [Rosa rugosa]
MLRAHYFLALLAVLFPLLVAGTEQNGATFLIGPGNGWKPVEDISAPLIIDIAKFAVSKYDLSNKKDLVFQNVTKGAYKEVLTGTQYRLVVTVRDNYSTLNQSPVYVANVVHTRRSPVNKLLSFEQISN